MSSGHLVLLLLTFLSAVQAGQDPATASLRERAAKLHSEKNYTGCVRAYEELAKAQPRDAGIQYNLGRCYLAQSRELAGFSIETGDDLRVVIQECDKLAEQILVLVAECNRTQDCKSSELNRIAMAAATSDSICKGEEIEVQRAQITATSAALQADSEKKRDLAIDAFLKSMAIGGSGLEPDMARVELEKVYLTLKNPPLSLDAVVVQKRKDLGLDGAK